ncbi:MAG: hypothetical protein U9O87_04785 [Verrucomicrobiota bacterium]|nr:hypothetical protein [Verrucomicrobiota bacterium]
MILIICGPILGFISMMQQRHYMQEGLAGASGDAKEQIIEYSNKRVLKSLYIGFGLGLAGIVILFIFKDKCSSPEKDNLTLFSNKQLASAKNGENKKEYSKMKNKIFFFNLSASSERLSTRKITDNEIFKYLFAYAFLYGIGIPQITVLNYPSEMGISRMSGIFRHIVVLILFYYLLKQVYSIYKKVEPNPPNNFLTCFLIINFVAQIRLLFLALLLLIPCFCFPVLLTYLGFGVPFFLFPGLSFLFTTTSLIYLVLWYNWVNKGFSYIKSKNSINGQQ